MNPANVGGETIAVVGLGYVGLPLAVALSAHHRVIGFDVNELRIDELVRCIDRTGEITGEELKAASITFSADSSALADATIFIVTVPTPVDEHRAPDLRPLQAASRTIGRALRPGTVVVYESTVYPGATEEICAPILEAESGLRVGDDFALGYSPERINPGDKVHTFAKVVKVISASDPVALDRIDDVYRPACTAGLHRAPSIRVAEAAKVIENTQRDLNIALMNELALIFDRLGINTNDVLEAAGTKWNFLRFVPGLVGGHCIGVDPYYLTHKAQAVGYHPEVILAGRRVNDGMSAFVAAKTVKMLAAAGIAGSNARVLVLGLTFKEDVPDLRNSRVPEIVTELREFGCQVEIHDPAASSDEAMHEYGLELRSWPTDETYDAAIVAVPHAFYRGRDEEIAALVRPGGPVIDVKSTLDHSLSVWDKRALWAL